MERFELPQTNVDAVRRNLQAFLGYEGLLLDRRAITVPEHAQIAIGIHRVTVEPGRATDSHLCVIDKAIDTSAFVDSRTYLVQSKSESIRYLDLRMTKTVEARKIDSDLDAAMVSWWEALDEAHSVGVLDKTQEIKRMERSAEKAEAFHQQAVLIENQAKLSTSREEREQLRDIHRQLCELNASAWEEYRITSPRYGVDATIAERYRTNYEDFVRLTEARDHLEDTVIREANLLSTQIKSGLENDQGKIASDEEIAELASSLELMSQF